METCTLLVKHKPMPILNQIFFSLPASLQRCCLSMGWGLPRFVRWHKALSVSWCSFWVGPDCFLDEQSISGYTYSFFSPFFFFTNMLFPCYILVYLAYLCKIYKWKWQILITWTEHSISHTVEYYLIIGTKQWYQINSLWFPELVSRKRKWSIPKRQLGS